MKSVKVSSPRSLKVPKVSYKADDVNFLPMQDQFGGFDLKAGQSVTVNPRKTSLLDCGIALNLPKKYRLELICSQEFTNKGLFLVNNTYPNGDEQRLSIIVHNIGHQIVPIPVGTVIGKFWFSEVTSVAMVSS